MLGVCVSYDRERDHRRFDAAHGRRSIRLKGYDYSRPGAYYVTICTYRQACALGRVVDGEMVFNDAGRIVQECWDDLPNHYSHVRLDAFVIMPNHVHGIIVLTRCGVGAGLGPAEMVALGSREEPASRDAVRARKPAPTNHDRATVCAPKPDVRGKRHGLPEIVRGFKTFSARRINRLRGTTGTPVWQRNYYEHIVRNEEDLCRIREYVAGNPARWPLDAENPSNVRQGR